MAGVIRRKPPLLPHSNFRLLPAGSPGGADRLCLDAWRGPLGWRRRWAGRWGTPPPPPAGSRSQRQHVAGGRARRSCRQHPPSPHERRHLGLRENDVLRIEGFWLRLHFRVWWCFWVCGLFGLVGWLVLGIGWVCSPAPFAYLRTAVVVMDNAGASAPSSAPFGLDPSCGGASAGWSPGGPDDVIGIAPARAAARRRRGHECRPSSAACPRRPRRRLKARRAVAVRSEPPPPLGSTLALCSPSPQEQAAETVSLEGRIGFAFGESLLEFGQAVVSRCRRATAGVARDRGR